MTTVRGWRLAALALTGAIIILGVAPIGGMVEVVGPPDPVTTAGHFFSYAVLGFVLPFALSGGSGRPGTLVLAFLLAVALGAAVEGIQGPIPYRDASLLDLAVDMAGAAVGLVVFSLAARAKRSRSRPG